VRILVIDDEAKAADQLARALTESGYRAGTVNDGRDGLEKASRSNYDLIISDIMMPRFDGFSMVHELRRIGSSTPVLFVTARHDFDAKVRGLDLGADGCLLNPFALPDLSLAQAPLTNDPMRKTS